MSGIKSSTSSMITLAVLVHKPNQKYLFELLDSCNAQNAPHRLDIIEDSPSPTPQLLEWVAEHKHARYIDNSDNNDGLPGNWNTAVANSRTSWISVIHQDDVLGQDYVKMVESLIERNPLSSAVFTHAQIIDSHGKRAMTVADLVKSLLLLQHRGDPYTIKGQQGLVKLLRGNTVFCPSLCINTKATNFKRFNTSLRMVPDLRFLCDTLLNGGELVGSKEKHYFYRRHPGQATEVHQASLLRFEEELSLYAEVTAEASRRGFLKASQTAKKACIIHAHIYFDMLRALLAGDYSRYRMLRKLK